MKFNKKIVIPLFCLSFLLILIGTYVNITKQEEELEKGKVNRRLNEIAQKFNQKNVTVYFEGQNVEMKAKASSSTLFLYYILNDKENAYQLELNQNILESKDVLDEVTTGNLLDTLLTLKEENSYSFFGVLNNHTILDYSLQQDGLEIEKKENGYKVKVDLSKQLAVKEYFDVLIEPQDIKNQILKIEYDATTYYQKGYILYKEETDIKGNQVITFAQSKYCNIENLRQSIASYLELAKGKDIKEQFLKEVTIDSLETQSATREQYNLNSTYIVFKEDVKDECFDYYLSNNYRVVTLIISTK